MRINALVLLSMVPLALAGCEREAERTGEMADSIAAEAARADAGQSMAADTLEVVAEGEGQAGGMQASVVMNELSGSGVGGDATVAAGQSAGQARATVNLTASGGAGGVHQGHIHEGRCDDIGGVVVPLPPVTVAGGAGTASSSVAVDAMSVMDGNHVIVYHEAGGDPGSLVVCGEIPGHEM